MINWHSICSPFAQFDSKKDKIPVDIPQGMRYPARMNDTHMKLDTPDGMARAVAWQTWAMKWMKDGAIWVVPQSFSIIQVFPSKKSAVIKTPGIASMVDLVKLVFLNMGWTVVEHS